MTNDLVVVPQTETQVLTLDAGQGIVTLTSTTTEYANIVGGAEGPTGPTGAKGDTGDTGPTGLTPLVTAAATPLTSTSTPTVIVTGTTATPLLTFGIPRGATGPVGPPGSTVVQGYYGAFQSDVTQRVPTTTQGYPMVLEVTDGSNGVRVANDAAATPTRITFDYSGTYNVQWSGQFQNSTSQELDTSIWLRKNNLDVEGSTGFVAVPGGHGSLPGHSIVGWNYILDFSAGDYLEFIWKPESTNVVLQYYPATATPFTPSTASVIATAQLVTYIQPGPTPIVTAAATPLNYAATPTVTVGGTAATPLLTFGIPSVTSLPTASSQVIGANAATPNKVMDTWSDDFNLTRSSECSTMPRLSMVSSSSMSSGAVYGSRALYTGNQPTHRFTGIRFAFSVISSTTFSSLRAGLYDSLGTPVTGGTTSDLTSTATASTHMTAAFATPVTLTPGTPYFLALGGVFTGTAPTIRGANLLSSVTALGPALTRTASGWVGGATPLPNLSGTAGTNVIPWMELY